MRRTGRPHTRWAILGAIVTLVAACGLFRPVSTRILSQPEALVEARERWDARPFKRYRMGMLYSSHQINCRQDVEIRGEMVITIFQNTCPQGALTVSAIFKQIDTHLDTHAGQCGPNGCGCDGPIGVDADYDAQFGYPRSMELRLRPEERWQYIAYWRYVLPGGFCQPSNFRSQTIRVVSLTPIP